MSSFLLLLKRSYAANTTTAATASSATTTTTTAATTKTTATATNSTTTTAGSAATAVLADWPAGYSTTATVAGHDAASAACVIGARPNEPSLADATNVPKPVHAKHCE